MNNKLALLFIAVLVGLKFIIVPWFDWVSETTADIEQKERSYAKLSRLSDQQEKAQAEIKRLEQQLAPLEKKKLPNSRAKITTMTLDYMSDLGKKFDVTVRNQRLGEIQEGQLNYVPLNLMVEGDPIGIAQFITELETGKYIMVVAQASITKNTRIESRLSLNLTLYLATKES
ncbi:putative general secretion pathway protein [Aliivibrio wodanis]|uniref:Putative general secretion pathway protein n=1 Tax=Aliivibrio wodanis TaxID=80852 RepID=A0A090KF81_9GAMM|nr:putative general secretion pathway protein [Aliivibrio wodanis]